MFQFLCTPFQPWASEAGYDFATYLQYLNTRPSILSTHETVAFFVLCYPSVFHWFADDERVRILHVLKFIIHQPVSGLDLNARLKEEMQMLCEYVEGCIDAFFAAGTKPPVVSIPSHDILCLIPRANMPLPTEAELQAIIEDYFRLGSKSARAYHIKDAVAFAMGAHPRLGANSTYANVGASQTELIQEIMRMV